MTERPIYVARDSQDRWCAAMLNERNCGTSWLLLDEGVPEETVSLAIFVLTGEGSPHGIARIDPIERSVIARLASDGDEKARSWVAGLEHAVSLDDLIQPPDWIRKAAS